MITDEEILQIVLNDKPYPDTKEMADKVRLAIANAQITILLRASKKALKIMNAYKRSGYGDDVFMSALSEAHKELNQACLIANDGKVKMDDET